MTVSICPISWQGCSWLSASLHQIYCNCATNVCFTVKGATMKLQVLKGCWPGKTNGLNSVKAGWPSSVCYNNLHYQAQDYIKFTKITKQVYIQCNYPFLPNRKIFLSLNLIWNMLSTTWGKTGLLWMLYTQKCKKVAQWLVGMTM